MVDIKKIESLYFCNGFPVPYKLKKGSDFFIYPILVKDYPIYEEARMILNLPKNEINDIKIIQMSYLEFLGGICASGSEPNIVNKIIDICQLCFHENKVAFQKDNGNICLAFTDDECKVTKIISPKEFEEIRKIILFQNDSKYDDRYISQDVREAYEEYCKLKFKNVENPSLEKKKAFVMSKNGFSLNQINDLPYRFFDLIYHSCVDSETYLGDKIIQGSFKYKVDKDIIHPQFQKNIDPIAEMFGDAENFEKKIQQVNG